MSAPVAEAHRELAYAILFATEDGRAGPNETAQLIADSEAKATAELRAVFPQILAALGNGACCAPDVSVEFIQSIPNEVVCVIAKLRAEVEAQCLLNGKGSEREADLRGRLERAEREVERLKADGAASAFVAMSCRASRAETDRNNLRADLDAIKAILTEEKARAERAEAESIQLKKTNVENADSYRLMQGRVIAAEVELATERARLDAVVANCWAVHSEGGSSFSVFSNVCGDYIATAQTYRAAIDAAMKEGT